jgi:thiol-disulfide isomerase/thioredoxin
MKRNAIRKFVRAYLTITLAAMVGLAAFDRLPRTIAASNRIPAPNFSCDVWLNSPSLTLDKLRGKVVLIDFWEYTCINCIRTFPYLRRWNRLYGPLGLVVIGVHTPEFAFGRDRKVVEQAARRFGFTFPIAVDSDRKVWDAFSNDAWPSKYLIDKNGNIAYTHVGEGDYAEFERHIQQLLIETNPRLEATFAEATYTPSADEPMFGGACRLATPETYLGFARGDRIANAKGYQPLQRAVYKTPPEIPSDGYALDGTWLATPEALLHHTSANPPGDSLTLRYRAKSVYLVAGSDDRTPKRLYVFQDGKPMPADARGVDVKSGEDGRAYIVLSGKRMYYVVNNPGFGEHLLKLSTTDAGLSLYSFTFGNNCENPFDHR